jgi:ethanolamine utilization cobalamin adenosyltransferase
MALDDKTIKGAPRLGLEGAAATRKTLARLLRLRFRGEIDTVLFRDMFYGLNVALGYDKLLADLRIEERLDLIEAQMKEEKK